MGRLAVPKGWTEIDRCEMNREVGLMLAGVGTVMMVLAALIFAVLAGLLGVPLTWPRFTWVAWLAACLVTFPVHEFLHGLPMSRFGANPRYGWNMAGILPYVYCSGNGATFSRSEGFLILLAPLAVIDVAAILLMLIPPLAPFANAVFVVNTAGATGDLWLALRLLRAPRDCLIVDDHAAMRLFGRPETSATVPSERWWGSALGRALLIVFLSLALLPVPLMILTDALGLKAVALPPWLPAMTAIERGVHINILGAIFWWMVGSAILTLFLRLRKSQRK